MTPEAHERTEIVCMCFQHVQRIYERERTVGLVGQGLCCTGPFFSSSLPGSNQVRRVDRPTFPVHGRANVRSGPEVEDPAILPGRHARTRPTR